MTVARIRIGGSATADGEAFVEAWRRIEGGDLSPDHVLMFQSWDALASLMTMERLRVLRHLHRTSEPSIMALAKALGRQYRRVHDDVTILLANGLLVRDGDGIRTTIDRIEAVIELV